MKIIWYETNKERDWVHKEGLKDVWKFKDGGKKNT